MAEEAWGEDGEAELDSMLDTEPASQGHDLLQWCQALDFGTYADEWTCKATTLGSEAFVPMPESAALPAIPPHNTCVPTPQHGQYSWSVDVSHMHAATDAVLGVVS